MVPKKVHMSATLEMDTSEVKSTSLRKASVPPLRSMVGVPKETKPPPSIEVSERMLLAPFHVRLFEEVISKGAPCTVMPSSIVTSMGPETVPPPVMSTGLRKMTAPAVFVVMTIPAGYSMGNIELLSGAVAEISSEPLFRGMTPTVLPIRTPGVSAAVVVPSMTMLPCWFVVIGPMTTTPKDEIDVPERRMFV